MVGASEPMPARLGRYDVRAKIAEGGMATIYLGVGREGEHRRVALKVIKRKYTANPEFVAMFLDEAKLIERIEHPNVVRLFELGGDQGRLFLAMELLIGQSLWAVWEACRDRDLRLRYEHIAWIGARIAAGLEEAHTVKDKNGDGLRIVHRDVNASNVIVTYEGEVKVIDFGLAKGNNRLSRTAAGIVKGKLAYLAPEQTMSGELDHRADIFALGTTLWELATDRRLFKREDDAETLRAVHEANIPDPREFIEDFPPELWSILKKALARDREERFASAGEFAAALDAFADRAPELANAASVARVLKFLFADEQHRQMNWVAEASEAEVPLKTLHPGQFQYTLAPRGDRPTPLGTAIPRPGLLPRFDELDAELFLPAVPEEDEAPDAAPKGVPISSRSNAATEEAVVSNTEPEKKEPLSPSRDEATEKSSETTRPETRPNAESGPAPVAAPARSGVWGAVLFAVVLLAIAVLILRRT